MNISMLNYEDLELLKKKIAERQEYLRGLAENFMYNEFRDEYIYVLIYRNGDKGYEQTGQKAYKKYSESSDIVRLDRKTKDLRPKWETLLEKGNYNA